MGLPVFGSPDLLLVLLVALAADAVLGGLIRRVLPEVSTPVRVLCAELERRLNREARGERTRLARGALVVVVLVAVVIGLALALRTAGRAAGVAWAVDLAALILCFGGRAAWGRVRAARRALDTSVSAARPMMTALTRRPVDGLDGHALVRAAIEHLVRSFDRKLVAPAFWYALAGLPGLLVWVAVDGADAALGVPGVRTGAFGLTAARLDDALNAIPARLSAALLALAALFLGGARFPRAVRVMWRDARRPASFNMGWPIAAVAGALDLALGGPYRDGGVVVNDPWVGDGRARAMPADIDRALALSGLADLLAMLGVGLLLGVASGF
jgi:adenosylcobinamide-phosphate synthase